MIPKNNACIQTTKNLIIKRHVVAASTFNGLDKEYVPLKGLKLN